MEPIVPPVRGFRQLHWGLGLLTCASVALYGLGTLIQMPSVSPDGFIPQTLDAPPAAGWLARLSPWMVLLYAFSFLPVMVAFAIARFRRCPYGMTLAACLVVVSLLIEINNALPMVAFSLVHPRPPALPPELLLYLRQTEAIRFLAFDVAGFSLAYAGLFLIALMFHKTHRWLARLTVGSLVLFVANVPCLWFSPMLAVVLMVLSIFLFALVPLLLVRMTTQEWSAPAGM